MKEEDKVVDDGVEIVDKWQVHTCFMKVKRYMAWLIYVFLVMTSVLY